MGFSRQEYWSGLSFPFPGDLSDPGIEPTSPAFQADFLKFYFNWRLITLQYCGGFCHTSTWISHRCTCVPPSRTLLPPPSLFHPSGLSQHTSFECPASCIELGLVIYFTYGNIHVSMLFSQIIPPLPSPRVQKSVLYICVSFAVSHIGSSLPSF